MGLFLNEITLHRPAKRTSALAVWSLIITATGFLKVVGFVAGPVLAYVALMRLRIRRDRGETLRGRGLAISAIVLAAVAVGAAVVAILIFLLAAYAALPSPPGFTFS